MLENKNFKIRHIYKITYFFFFKSSVQLKRLYNIKVNERNKPHENKRN